jgi:hypothetical protein
MMCRSISGKSILVLMKFFPNYRITLTAHIAKCYMSVKKKGIIHSHRDLNSVSSSTDKTNLLGPIPSRLRSPVIRPFTYLLYTTAGIQNSPSGIRPVREIQHKTYTNEALFCHSPQCRYPVRTRSSTTVRSHRESCTVD